MFKPGFYYRSVNCRDVGFEVLEHTYVKGELYHYLKVSWVNIGHCHLPWHMGISQRIVIQTDMLPTYQKIDYDFRTPAAEYGPFSFFC